MKYIVEADEHVQMISLIAVREGTAIMITGNVETFQTADKAIDEAYQKGFEAGQHEATTLEYQQGLNDAWECARKICIDKEDGGISSDELMEIFKVGCDSTVFKKYSASEAIAKLREYEQQKADEIKVGDEVIPINAIRRPFVVVSIENNVINGFDLANGYTPRGCHRDETNWEKTGRHFPQVAELVKAMKEGAE